MKVNVFKDPNLIFSPTKVDVSYWQSMVNVYFYLSNPEELHNLYKENPDEYYKLIDPLGRFIMVTESELKDKGFIEEKEGVN